MNEQTQWGGVASARRVSAVIKDGEDSQLELAYRNFCRENPIVNRSLEWEHGFYG
jgi:hypothetical protein